MPRESVAAIMTALRAVLERYGIPIALYTDRAHWAVHTPTSGSAPDRRPPADPASAFVPLGRVDLEQILCVDRRAFVTIGLAIASADPDDRSQDAEGSRSQSRTRDAPAHGCDQPLSERSHHEDAEPHPRKGDPDRSPSALREPAGDEHAHRHRAEPHEPAAASTPV